MKLSQPQFDALTAYVEAVVTLAVAKSEYRCSRDSDKDYLIEGIRMDKARDAAEAALVDRDIG